MHQISLMEAWTAGCRTRPLQPLTPRTSDCGSISVRKFTVSQPARGPNRNPMNLKQRSASFAGLLISAAALWPLVAGAQTAAKPAADTLEKKDEAVELSPFTVTTNKDRGYAATNAISGSRVDTPIKDLPVPMQVVTSEFIRDTGATDLRKSLSYVAGISLQSQNDLENNG